MEVAIEVIVEVQVSSIVLLSKPARARESSRCIEVEPDFSVARACL